MPSDTLGSARQEGNGSSVPTVINRMCFVYSPHLLSTVPCQGCAGMSLPTMAWRNLRFLSQYQILCQEEEVAPGKGANKIKHCILDSSVLFWGIYHSDCAAVMQLTAEQREFNKVGG